MENEHKHRNTDLVNTQKHAKSLVSTPVFKHLKLLTENLVQLSGLQERSKKHARLLFNDIDCLMYYIYTEYMYQDMANLTYILDTSDYLTSHLLYITQHKKKLSYF